MTDALVIGGGPAGLMAAETLLSAGRKVVLAEAKPSLARKFLMAGKSGLNLTKMEPLEPFMAAYGEDAARLRPMIEALPPGAVQSWAQALGQQTFTGSTGRLFPRAMKASPLLRAWLARLVEAGLVIHTRWRWQGWEDATCLFETPEGLQRLTPSVTVLALGGGSWARLGSDGLWRGVFDASGIKTLPFEASNAAISVAWSDHMIPHFGAPIKAVRWTAGDITSRGEATLSPKGLEGGGIYPLAPALRAGLPLHVDLTPDLTLEALEKRLARPHGKQSLSNHIRKSLGLAPQTRALLMECGRPLPSRPEPLARLVKALPVSHQGLATLDQAISTTGGVPWEALDATLQLKARPGTFCCGEMIDWDAPTGGYLLTACLATGLHAGKKASQIG